MKEYEALQNLFRAEKPNKNKFITAKIIKSNSDKSIQSALAQHLLARLGLKIVSEERVSIIIYIIT